MSAIRLARAVTGREKMLKFAGAYHGHVDGLLAEAGSGLATQGIPASPGVPAAAAAATVIVPWNDADALRAATAAGDLAAILAEPVPANMGRRPAEPGFLELLRGRPTPTGALLIFDEVITGFRVARGGAQERFGVAPDLTIMGKIVGGGLPAAAYGGSRELMEQIAPAGDVYQAGTLSGNPLAVAAALATLERLDGAAYERLARHHRGARRRAARRGRAPPVASVQVQSLPGLLTVFFSAEPVTRLRRRRGVRHRRLRPAGAASCSRRGVYPPPSQFEAWFPSLAARAGARAAHDRRRRRGVRGAVSVSALRAALAAQGGTVSRTLAAGRRDGRRDAGARPGSAQLAAAGPAGGRPRAPTTSCCWR